MAKIPDKYFKIESETNALGNTTYNLWTVSQDIYIHHTAYPELDKRDWYFITFNSSKKSLLDYAQHLYNTEQERKKRNTIVSKETEYIS